jgi:alkylation response protein AidB-like acyl-CoA dehydrogenase
MRDDAITEDARMIAESAMEFAKGSGGVGRARALRNDWPQFDQAIWERMAELGWLGIVVPEEHGGLGLGAHEMCALLESVGRSLVPEPLVPAIASAGLLAACDTWEAARLLAEQAVGKRLWTVAPTMLSALSFPHRLLNVPDCYAGTGLLVAYSDVNAFEIRAIDTHAAGADIGEAECVDGSVLADIVIDQTAWTQAAVIGAGPAGQMAWGNALDIMLLGYSAYLVGLMDEALQITIDYMKIRSQFDSPIGAFQALQHRAASCHVDVVASRALLYDACKAFPTDARGRAASAAKARASAAALRVTKECVQFHGAIGFADEHDIGLYLRKAMTIAARQGGEMRQKLRFAQLGSTM